MKRMMSMSNYSKNDIVLIKYPFSDLSNFKVRPAVIVSDKYPSYDIIITPLTSKINSLLPGEFIINDYLSAGLNVETAVKRGLYTIDNRLIIQDIGKLSISDSNNLEKSIRLWLSL